MKKDKCHSCLTVEATIIERGKTESAVLGACRDATQGCNDICPSLKKALTANVFSCKVCSNDETSILIQAIFV